MKEVALTPEYLRKLGEGMREQIMATISPKERLAGLSPETILSHVSPEQLLAELDPEVIEVYLQKRKQSETTKSPGKSPEKPLDKPATPRRKAKKTYTSHE